MIEIQPVALDAAIAHQQAITNASHLLSCADYLLERLPEETQELPILADLSVLLSKVGDEIQAARMKFETKEKAAPVAPWRNQQEQEQPQKEAAPRPKCAPWRDGMDAEMRKHAAKQEAGKQALSELRSALMQQTIMIRQLADNAGIEDIDTEHEATKLAKDIYFAMDRAWDCVNRATA